ncbi:MAG TPA: protease modulator HflC [Dehalococcoidia bacterium]|nr:protease modulator HflC [Dehalococcoidia bacterium]
MSRLYLTAAALALVLFFLPQLVYAVDETNQVVITRLGQFQRTDKSPGLKFKQPFLDTANYIERRVLTSDAETAEYITSDKKRLAVDPVTRWRIVDAYRFFISVRDEAGARVRLDDLVFSALRRELAADAFEDVIAKNREAIMETVAASVRAQAKDFGIEIIDVRIKRADLPREVQGSVFARMVAERQREASRLRAEGEERARLIRGDADRQSTIISAEAQRQAQQLRGEGDAEATAIYGSALQQDPEFYAFQRSLEAYTSILSAESTLILSADSELFRYLTRAGR